MKKLNKKQYDILCKNFSIYPDVPFNEINNNVDFIEFEAWTNGGVDMSIPCWLNEGTILEGFERYIEHFDIDNEIDIYRQDPHYKANFRITESVADFENWIIWVKEIKKELEDAQSK